MIDYGDAAGDSNIVSLNEVKSFDAGPALAQIEAYWQTARRGRLVPSRSDIDPRGLNGVLEHAFILERISSGLARFRVAGAHLRDLVGLELRGMPLSALFTPDAREPLSDMVAEAFDAPSIIHASIISKGGFMKTHLEGNMVLLPLRSDLGDVTRLLGGLHLRGDIGRAPRRLSITGQKRKGLTGYAGPEVSTENAYVATGDAKTSDARQLREAPAEASNVIQLFPGR